MDIIVTVIIGYFVLLGICIIVQYYKHLLVGTFLGLFMLTAFYGIGYVSKMAFEYLFK